MGCSDWGLPAGYCKGPACQRDSDERLKSAFTVRDHNVARLVDLFDLLGAAYRIAR